MAHAQYRGNDGTGAYGSGLIGAQATGPQATVGSPWIPACIPATALRVEVRHVPALQQLPGIIQTAKHVIALLVDIRVDMVGHLASGVGEPHGFV